MRKIASTTTVTAILVVLAIGTILAPTRNAVLAYSPGTDITYPSLAFNSTSAFEGPHVNTIVMPILSQAAQTAGIKSADESSASDLMTINIAAADLASVLANPNDIVRAQPEFGFRWLGFNFRNYTDPTISPQAGKDSSALAAYKAFRIGVDYLIPRKNVISSQLGGFGYVACQYTTDAWGAYFNATDPCRSTGTSAAANRPAALTSFTDLLSGPLSNKTSGCTGVTTSWCFANSTNGNEIHMALRAPDYDPVRLYAANQISINARAVGMDIQAIPTGFGIIVTDYLNVYKFQMLILGYGFTAPIADALYVWNTVEDLCPNGAGSAGCAPEAPNTFGLHDAYIDHWTSIVHTNTNFATVFQAAKNVLGQMYADADFLAMWSRNTNYGARTTLYQGYFNRPGTGIGDFTTTPFEEEHIHRQDLDYWSTLVHPNDNPTRPFTLDLLSDVSYVNRWEVPGGSVYDVIVNGMYEGADTLSYLNATDFSVLPLVAHGTSPGSTADVVSATVGGQPGLKITYHFDLTAPRPALYGDGPGTSSYGRLVSANDYKNTLDYMEAEQPANFATLLAELFSYSASCSGTCPAGQTNTLEIDLNQTGYFKLYDTAGIFPTAGDYWCDATAPHSCLVKANNQQHATTEPAFGSPAEYKMLDWSTYGPFRIVSHNPGVAITAARTGSFVVPFWLSPARDGPAGDTHTSFEEITTCGSVGCLAPATPVFNAPMLTILLAVPTALLILARKRLTTHTV